MKETKRRVCEIMEGTKCAECNQCCDTPTLEGCANFVPWGTYSPIEYELKCRAACGPRGLSGLCGYGKRQTKFRWERKVERKRRAKMRKLFVAELEWNKTHPIRTKFVLGYGWITLHAYEVFWKHSK